MVIPEIIPIAEFRLSGIVFWEARECQAIVLA